MNVLIQLLWRTDSTPSALFVFLPDLDFASLARGFALLRLPKMPELRGKTFPDFVETTVDTNSIRYKDKNREKQRQKMLVEQKAKTSAPKKNVTRNAAWSKQKNKKERRKKRAAKRKQDEVCRLHVAIMLGVSTSWVAKCTSLFAVSQGLGWERWGYERAFKWRSSPQEAQKREDQWGGLWKGHHRQTEGEARSGRAFWRISGRGCLTHQQLDTPLKTRLSHFLFFFYPSKVDFIGSLQGTVINKAWWVHHWRPTEWELLGRWRGGWWEREACSRSWGAPQKGCVPSSECQPCTEEEE